MKNVQEVQVGNEKFFLSTDDYPYFKSFNPTKINSKSNNYNFLTPKKYQKKKRPYSAFSIRLSSKKKNEVQRIQYNNMKETKMVKNYNYENNRKKNKKYKGTPKRRKIKSPNYLKFDKNLEIVKKKEKIYYGFFEPTNFYKILKDKYNFNQMNNSAINSSINEENENNFKDHNNGRIKQEKEKFKVVSKKVKLVLPKLYDNQDNKNISILFQNNKYEKAKKVLLMYLDEINDMYPNGNENNLSTNISKITNNIGGCNFFLSKLKESVVFLKVSVKKSENIKNHPHNLVKIIGLSNLGSVYYFCKRYEKAIYYFDQSLLENVNSLAVDNENSEHNGIGNENGKSKRFTDSDKFLAEFALKGMYRCFKRMKREEESIFIKKKLKKMKNNYSTVESFFIMKNYKGKRALFLK